MKIKTKSICLMGLGIALYVVLSMTFKMPLISHIQTDLGYIVFGVYCVLFGWQGFIVGALGCMLESLIFNGWFPTGWIIGQIVIGVICGIAYKKFNSNAFKIVITVIAILIGIAGIKTLVECKLYSIPFAVKVIKNLFAAAADMPPMIIGLFVGNYLKSKRKWGD